MPSYVGCCLIAQLRLWLNSGINIFQYNFLCCYQIFSEPNINLPYFLNKQLALILTIFFCYFYFSFFYIFLLFPCYKQMHFVCIFFLSVCTAIPKCNSIMLCIFFKILLLLVVAAVGCWCLLRHLIIEYKK